MFIHDASMIDNIEYVSAEIAGYLADNGVPFLTIKDGTFGFRKTLKYKRVMRKLAKELKREKERGGET
jgi:hypothetical protein